MKFYNLLICFLIFLLSPVLGHTGNAQMNNAFEIVSDCTYVIAPSDAENLYESLCLFGAKYTAVALSAKYLSHTGVLKNYGNKTREIFCIIAEDLTPYIIKKQLINSEKYYVKVRTKINLADFTRAEIKNIEFEKQENQFSWQQEMEQYLFKTIEPGNEISRAYRYLRKKESRIAIIYLDHLEKKYPNWLEIYLAKAIGFYSLNKTNQMLKALDISCTLGNKEACKDLMGFSEHRKIPLAQ
ncbi:MAG: hypothetical protein HUN05_18070 [Desulfobacter sp.]|nr:MAG: hypothetical protein HUN05_18070 [Desulfobacter sp.]